ncbi:unnamed protein product [Haemonchus placei]|uniref:SUEL-type lectin domain-containing protein n=1 Tax=Haemonchus placei TaxID=6290 RepID=A0A0N4VSU9_HAEPC|nr:unnamed protein product [Haemonchus placei]
MSMKFEVHKTQCGFLRALNGMPSMSHGVWDSWVLIPSGRTGSIVVCEGGTAELECPHGMVISIALANYGRYSARVCYENEELDDVVPMTQCHNPKTMPTLRKRRARLLTAAAPAAVVAYGSRG